MKPRRVSRIGVQLLAFNLLLLFLPAAGLLTLGVFEAQLLAAQERAMVQQGRLLAAALAERGPIDPADAQAILVRLDRRLTARLRVTDEAGTVLADSSRLGPRRGPGDEPDEGDDARDDWLYRAVSGAFRLASQAVGSASDGPDADPDDAAGGPLHTPELDAALAGRYGAATRPSPGQRSLTLHSGIPVRSDGRVVGAVLVSQSTWRLLRDLYDVRLAILRVFLASLAAAAVLTLLASATIARPIARLRAEAAALLDRRGRLRGRFGGSTRRDEIGDLARALEELSQRLGARVGAMESYAADVSHAFKNPLAGVRAASELLAATDDPAERARYQAMVARDVARLERLLGAAREIARIDAGLEDEEPEAVPLGELVGGLVESFRLRFGERLRFALELPEGAPVRVRAAPGRLAEALENLIDNAASFSPPGGEVRITLRREGATAVVEVRDQGPGIPAEHLERVFERFFSWRPGEEGAALSHTGLGLPIARAVAEGLGGSLRVRRDAGAGACLQLSLPCDDQADAAR